MYFSIGQQQLFSAIDATLALRFRTKNICCWRFAFAQKTFAGL